MATTPAQELNKVVNAPGGANALKLAALTHQALSTQAAAANRPRGLRPTPVTKQRVTNTRTLAEERQIGGGLQGPNTAKTTGLRAVDRAVPNAPLVHVKAQPTTPTRQNELLGLNVRRSIDPRFPVSPRPATPITVNNKPTIFVNIAKAFTNIAARPGAAGVAPPTEDEATTHMTTTQWADTLNDIPAGQRNISGRDNYMSPRIDESSPTGLASVVASPQKDFAAALPNATDGRQTDETTSNAPASDMSVILVGLVALFGVWILSKRIL